MKIYQVGGSVRDQILGRVVNDRDWLVVGSSPAELIAQGFKPVGKDFPVFLHPQTFEEYALARTERKIANKKGHGDFIFYYDKNVRVEEDLIRRDLTINAIAIDENGNFIDPFHGQEDIKNKVFRHLSLAFAEDPLRIMRVARFCAQFPEFTIAPETLTLMQKMVQNGELENLPAERIWQEFSRGLSETAPISMINALDNIGALAKILPELTNLKNVAQALPWHPEKDAYEHTLLVLSAITKLSIKPQVRFAALCHDIGKGKSATKDLPNHPHHHLLGAELVANLCRRLKTPNLYQSLAEVACKYHDLVFKLNDNPKIIENWQTLFEGVDLWRRPQVLGELLLIVTADFQGRPGYANKEMKFTKIVEKIAREVNAPFTECKPTDKASKEAIIKSRIILAVNNYCQ